MNSLSWMIYFAGVLDSVGCLLSFAIGGSMLSFVCGAFAHIICDGDYDDDKAKRALARKYMMRGLMVLIGCAVLGAFLPTGKTIYAMAASEYGETLVKSPTMDKAQKALDAWIDRQIGDAKHDKGKP